ncbi:MAG TPA: PilT/PilU family type 4a pilus ATPase [Phycisphaerae bacterium]|nr:PilT/PilU family type 4a pilus ATPase [Phycisphaerae bacterium]HRY68539.1 PilT/PilU family type 4a pilus ATPase [Phycisphaerae bacterium]HSA25587.1 PilT/PilU family type 4a pilus ATPase [Phycisphaerae bacterium]
METTSLAPHDGELMGFLAQGLAAGASDLHLVAGYAPTLRIHGRLQALAGDPLAGGQIARMIDSVMPAVLKPQMELRKDLDFSLSFSQGGEPARFRVNVFHNQGSLGACFRFIPPTIPSFEWMGIPVDLARRIASLPGGLVLITGVTGAGKTTTLAGLVQMVSQSGNRRIVTIEEPIEYIFKAAAKSVISQREVGIDVDSFAEGLKYSLRQDPDVILCGEIRDRETAQMAISAAETGHLVLTTLHTQDARGAITRLVDIFPVDQHQDVRSQLSLSLRFVISQHLLPNIKPEEKRVLALEILVANDAVRAAIRMNKIETIDSLIQTGKKVGMQSLDENLSYLACTRRIAARTAHRFAKNPAGLRAMGVADVELEDGVSI